MLQTRFRLCVFWNDKGVEFQVPKGMLQTITFNRWDHRGMEEFQVPKGMLQTPSSACITGRGMSCFKSPRECYKLATKFIPSFLRFCCFKSPRECYKPRIRKLYIPYPYRFQVPKGMLQTFYCTSSLFPTPCFKSPRECYKPEEDGVQTDWHFSFQVPKGMLQTPVEDGIDVIGNTLGFKSPRECYKPSHKKNLWTFWKRVSSPQGNATNILFTWGGAKSLSRFKSPRECYKRKDAFMILPNELRFQVPKGMLQTASAEGDDLEFFAPFQVPKGMLQT